jgi:hypothetical protein
MIQEQGKLEINKAIRRGFPYFISSYNLFYVSMILQVDMIHNLIRCTQKHERPSRPAASLL